MSQKFVAYHLGVHGVLGRKINRFFRDHRAVLTGAGIHVPRPKVYRPYLRTYVTPPNAAPVSQREVLNALDCPDNYVGLCMSNDQALAANQLIFEHGEFLYWAEPRIEKLAALFPDHRIIFMIEVENFATFLPNHLAEFDPDEVDRISTWSLADFTWSDLIDGLQAVCPAAEIVVVPTEVVDANMRDIIAKITTNALLPRPTIPAPVSPEKLKAFQSAIAARMGAPMEQDQAENLFDLMGWDQEARILLSRQYYSDILKLYHTCTLII